MKIIVYTTNNYPYYDKDIITVRGLEAATKKSKEISDDIVRRINNGELQDGQVEVRYN